MPGEDRSQALARSEQADSSATTDEATTAATEAAQGSRLNVNINARTAKELRRIAKRSGITYTEAVRRAVEVLAFVMDERDAGNAIQVYEPGRNVTKELITL